MPKTKTTNEPLFLATYDTGKYDLKTLGTTEAQAKRLMKKLFKRCEAVCGPPRFGWFPDDIAVEPINIGKGYIDYDEVDL